MLKTDEDALICDLAETYHIFDIKAVSVTTLARLSCGLRENSRIKMKLTNREVSFDTWLYAAVLDELRWLHWAKTKDGDRNRNHPKPILEVISKKNEDKPTSFNSKEEFDRCREKILKGVHDG